MATLDLAQLRIDVKRHLRNRSDVTNTVVDHFINAGYLDFAGRIRLTELEDTKIFSSIITPTNSIAYVSTHIAVLSLHDNTNDIKVNWEPYATLRARPAQSATTGFVHSTSNRTIYIFPTPSAATVFSALVQKAPATLTDAADEPEVHNMYREGIVLLAARKAWDELGDSEQATLMDARFDKWVAQRQLTHLVEQRAQPRARGVRANFNFVRPDLGV